MYGLRCLEGGRVYPSHAIKIRQLAFISGKCSQRRPYRRTSACTEVQCPNGHTRHPEQSSFHSPCSKCPKWHCRRLDQTCHFYLQLQITNTIDCARLRQLRSFRHRPTTAVPVQILPCAWTIIGNAFDQLLPNSRANFPEGCIVNPQ